jgi:hypothetical protein
MGKGIIPSNAGIIQQSIKDAGLDPNEDYVSMQHFIERAINVSNDAENAYYDADEKTCEEKLDEAIKILQAAKVFNQNYGL